MIESLNFLPKEALTAIIAASPFSELRGSIPLAMLLWHFPALKAYLWSVFGNFLPVIPLLLFWNFAADGLSRRSYWLNRFFAWLFERTRRRHAGHFETWKGIALMIFVAIPLPLTGAWSGTIAAFVFGVTFLRATTMIALGILIAGLAVLLLTAAATNAGSFF